MNPLQSISSVFRNYANFSGRAQRSEFWWFALFSIISQSILNLVPFLGWIYSLVLLLPSLAVTARRLHDTGRSALWLLIYLVIILGWIVGGIITVVQFVGAVDEEAVQDRLESKLERRVSRSEALLIIEACDELDDVELSEREWEEWDETCDAIYGGLLDSIVFLLIWGLVSAVGVIAILVLCAFPGNRGPNRYGPDPLLPDAGTGGYGGPGDPYAAQPPGGSAGMDEPAPHPDLPQAGQPPSGQGSRRYCTQCGTPMQSDARFCTYCGAAI